MCTLPLIKIPKKFSEIKKFNLNSKTQNKKGLQNNTPGG
jgi:hypothetical protein